MADEKLIYGTAWKGDQTADLVCLALKSGFRAIATAAQPKHYREDLVGEGIRRAISDGVVTRQDLFIQTTFTPYPSQDPRDLPYDPHASLEEQVQTSLANSLATVATVPYSSSSVPPPKPYLDALVLHVPYLDPGHTRQVWAAMSRAVGEGHVRQLGISNTSLADLERVVRWCEEAGRAEQAGEDDDDEQLLLVRPTIVQNRFYPGHAGDFDRAVRQYCCRGSFVSHHHNHSHDNDDDSDHKASPSVVAPQAITYQAFGFLRNRALVQDKASVGVVARILGLSPQVALYALMIEVLSSSFGNGNKDSSSSSSGGQGGGGDIRVLDGTTKEERMREDLQGVSRAVAALRRAAAKGGEEEERGPVGDVSSRDEELRRAIESFRIGFGEQE